MSRPNLATAPQWLRWLPWMSLAAFTALWLSRWPSFPLILDPAYHLFVARQVVDAGGPMAYEWWEHAPVGRPHLYPPVLHLLLAVLMEAGCAPITAIRVVSVVLLPALLLTVFLVTRRLVGPSVALACLWVGMVPFSFHLYSAIMMAATLGMIELLWFILAVERSRSVAAGLLLALLFYTHLGLPWVAVVMACGYGWVRPAVRTSVLKAGWGLLGALPWLMHLMRHRSAVHLFVPQWEHTTPEIMPLLCVVAMVGVWGCWRERGRFLWFLACLASFALLAFHLFRWLGGEGLLPVILLAGVGVDRLARGRGARTPLPASVIVLLLLVLSPTLAYTDAGWRWVWPDSAPWHLAGTPATTRKAIDESVYSPHLERIVTRVGERSLPHEMLWSNAPYAGGLVAALAHRPTTSAMLNEVPAAHPLDPIGAAHLVVWFKFGQMSDVEHPEPLRRYPLTKVADEEVAVIFRQTGVTRTANPPHAVLPLWWTVVFLVLATGGIVWDMGRSRHSGAIPV